MSQFGEGKALDNSDFSQWAEVSVDPACIEFFISFNFASKFLFIFSSPLSKSIPNIVKVLSHSRPKSGHRTSLELLLVPNQVHLHFEVFIFRPEVR